MRNESDYIYYFSSEQKSEPKHAAVKCAPKHLKKHRHIRAIHLFALCYLLIAAMLMSTSGSFAKFTETSPVSVQSATVASFNYTVNQITGEALEKIKTDPTTRNDYGLSDSDVVVCAFEVSNADAEGNISDVALSCDVELGLTGKFTMHMVEQSDGIAEYDPEDMNNYKRLGNLSDYIDLVYKYNTTSHSISVKSLDRSSNKNFVTNSDNIPMLMYAGEVLEIERTINLSPKWTDVINLPLSNNNDTITCIVKIDMEELGYTGEPINFTALNPNDPENLKITVNQVD